MIFKRFVSLFSVRLGFHYVLLDLQFVSEIDDKIGAESNCAFDPHFIKQLVASGLLA